MTHRLRFTQDCFGDDFPVVAELFERSGPQPARVQVWIDEGLCLWDPNLTNKITRQLESPNSGIELVAPIEQLPGGEAVKNDPRIVHHLLESFNRDNLDRRSYVLVVGGGAILDTVGYAAAIAHRGIRLIRVPTTTLAQADSGVGVKNAVNWFSKKNWKGTFATPWAVVNDQRLLDGLSDRDFRCGFSEAVKVSLLKSPDFFHFLTESAEAIAAREQPQTREPSASRCSSTFGTLPAAAIPLSSNKLGRSTLATGRHTNWKPLRSIVCGMAKPWELASPSTLSTLICS